MPALDARRPASIISPPPLWATIDAEVRATAETLAKRGRAVGITVPVLTSRPWVRSLCISCWRRFCGPPDGVDPFDQPAVEEGKVLARKYLEGKA